MVEVESKILLSDCRLLDEVKARVLRLGGVPEAFVEEEDTYYQHPCRDFAKTDEALRLRVAGGRAELTYKGPKRIIRGSKAREEITLPINNIEDARRLLEALGFRPVAVVRKKRGYYVLGDVSISLDRVEGLGCFVEAEYRGEGGLEEAAENIEETLERLGVARYPRTTKSYLELVLEKRRAAKS